MDQEEEADKLMAMYKKGKFVGFNPTVKRTVVGFLCFKQSFDPFTVKPAVTSQNSFPGELRTDPEHIEVYCEHEEKGKFKISKGLVNKVLITGDDGGDCWECVDADPWT